MKTKLTNLWTRILVVLLGVLGFACGDSEEDNGMVELYGCPNASFKVSGTVTDQDKKPVADAKVVVTFPYHRLDTLVTKADGTFELKSENMGTSPMSIVTFKDGYTRDSVAIEMDYIDGDDDWYVGSCDTTYNPVISKLPEENNDPENNEAN